MSEGLTTYDFVQQVYYAQEKVILDFWPDDDKFKEVLFEANLVLQELQNSEDWTWLREQLVLGPCYHVPNEIPEFELPDWVYKVSTLNHDALRLHPILPYRHYHHRDEYEYNQHHFIPVPIASSGDNRYRRDVEVDRIARIHMQDPQLRAVKIGNIITFNRPLLFHEERTVAVLDVQRRIEQFHICDSHCELVTEVESYDKKNKRWVSEELDKPVCLNDCEPIYQTSNGKKHLVGVRPKKHLIEIPDPNYVVMATAARHAEGSPPALARVAGLQDAAQKIMSAMRQNDAAATDADYQDWDIPGFIEVI